MTAEPAAAPLAPVTVITGGSRGIGRALAFEFARGGHPLLLVARDEAMLRRTADEIRPHAPAPVDSLALDLASPDAADRIEARLAARGQYCRHLVNNAGIGLAGRFEAADEARLLELIDVNMRVLTQLSHRFLPGMKARRDGGILNVASLGGMVAGPYQAAYYASKAYVLSLSQALGWECFGSGVRISALAPGPVRTEFHQRMGARHAFYMRLGAGISPERAARMGYSGFMCGKALIIPGLLGPFNALALKLIPHDLLLPLIGWFLKARTRERDSI
jgi:short-subunit dehydrogenase